MAVTPESGFLAIADLTGYTAYLAGSEIEHAPAIAGDLLETIVGRLEPPFRLSKFEGDAAFLFAEGVDVIDGAGLAADSHATMSRPTTIVIANREREARMPVLWAARHP